MDGHQDTKAGTEKQRWAAYQVAPVTGPVSQPLSVSSPSLPVCAPKRYIVARTEIESTRVAAGGQQRDARRKKKATTKTLSRATLDYYVKKGVRLTAQTPPGATLRLAHEPPPPIGTGRLGPLGEGSSALKMCWHCTARSTSSHCTLVIAGKLVCCAGPRHVHATTIRSTCPTIAVPSHAIPLPRLYSFPPYLYSLETQGARRTAQSSPPARFRRAAAQASQPLKPSLTHHRLSASSPNASKYRRIVLHGDWH